MALQEDRRVEPSVRAMEEAAVPEICVLGSNLLSRLAAWYVGAISPACCSLTRWLPVAPNVTLRRT